MLSTVLEFLFLASVVVGTGVIITRCADVISSRTGLGHSMGGLLLLAGATSMPEYAIGWNCVRIEAYDMAMSGMIGSSLFNLLILAILDLMTRTRGAMLSLTAASHALSAVGSMLLTAVVLLFLLIKTDLKIAGFHLEGVVVLLVYLFALRLIYYDNVSEAGSLTEEEQEPEPSESNMSMPLAIIGYLFAVVVLFWASPNLAAVADELADRTGLGESFFGVIFVSIITSLPESVTTFAAIRMNKVNMAIGNIFGSNAFNMALVGLIDLTTPGSFFNLVSDVHAITATSAIMVSAVATLGLLYRAEKRLFLLEPDAVLVALLVLVTLFLVYIH